MAKPCSVCQHKDVDKINTQLFEGITFESLSKTYKLSVTALHRHKTTHIPTQLIKSQDAQEIAAADSLMGRLADLNEKAEGVYSKADEANNLTAALQAIRELREIATLYAKITGELQSQNVTNIIVAPEWVSLRNLILVALEPYPAARTAVIEAVERIE